MMAVQHKHALGLGRSKQYFATSPCSTQKTPSSKQLKTEQEKPAHNPGHRKEETPPESETKKYKYFKHFQLLNSYQPITNIVERLPTESATYSHGKLPQFDTRQLKEGDPK